MGKRRDRKVVKATLRAAVKQHKRLHKQLRQVKAALRKARS